jgi:tetratricopeptide (TPR) repeat protein
MKNLCFVLILFSLLPLIADAQTASIYENSNQDIQETWNKVEQLEKENNLIEGEKELRRLTESYPTHAGVWYVFGLNLIKQKKADEAITAFKNSLNIAPEAIGPLFYLGITLSNQKQDYKAAIPYLKKHLELQTQDFQRRNILGKIGSLNQHLAQALYGAKRFEEALVEYRQLVSRVPDNLPYLFQLTRCYLELQRFSEAEEILSRSVEFGKNSHVFWKLYGDVLSKQGKFAEAEQAYKKLR